MNFLAHIYLSETNDQVMVGNFIGDFVKGKAWMNFPDEIQKGILLHRGIDEFTDSHAVVSRSKSRLWARYRHYAAVIVDVFYDHFLAANWSQFHPDDLLKFTESTYGKLQAFGDVLPEGANRILHYMSTGNWLYHYQHVEGIRQALAGMSRRTSFQSGMEHAADDLEANYEAFEADFFEFFPHIRNFSHSFLTR